MRVKGNAETVVVGMQGKNPPTVDDKNQFKGIDQ
jgi:hypothetical protein